MDIKNTYLCQVVKTCVHVDLRTSNNKIKKNSHYIQMIALFSISVIFLVLKKNIYYLFDYQNLSLSSLGKNELPRS